MKPIKITETPTPSESEDETEQNNTNEEEKPLTELPKIETKKKGRPKKPLTEARKKQIEAMNEARKKKYADYKESSSILFLQNKGYNVEKKKNETKKEEVKEPIKEIKLSEIKKVDNLPVKPVDKQTIPKSTPIQIPAPAPAPKPFTIPTNGLLKIPKHLDPYYNWN